jgi:hypothetical protein
MSDHDTLILHGARWLRRQGCRLVIPDARNRANAEHPDVIGWMPSGDSIVIEAKSNHVDFRDDWRPDRKHFRRDGTGMGIRRYYICRPGVITEPAARLRLWGLIHAYPSELRTVVKSPEHDRNHEAELRLITRISTNSEAYPAQLAMEF